MNANAPTSNNPTMKKTLLFLLTLILLAACKETPLYTVSGNCGASNDTLYLFGLDSRYDRIDEIVCNEEGAFSHAIDVAESTPLIMAMPDGTMITLFAEPDMEAVISGDLSGENGWIVKGGEEQALYDSIASILKKLNSNSERVVHIDNFIKSHPFSNTNIEILRRFMVEVPNPNNGFIKKRISSLGGTLQDHEYFTGLQKLLDSKNSNNIHKMMPSIDHTTSTGKKITYKEYREKLLIVNFWAAWDNTSRTKLKEQSEFYAKYDTSKVRVLNISLDYDTAVWRKSIAEDCIAGDHVCDGKAWDNDIASKFAITSLPFTLLVSPYQRIDLFGLENDKFTTSIDSYIDKYFNKKKKR